MWIQAPREIFGQANNTGIETSSSFYNTFNPYFIAHTIWADMQMHCLLNNKRSITPVYRYYTRPSLWHFIIQ
jgi:hypothetical protein